MALIDVSELMYDADFTDEAVLIARRAVVNQWGETDLTESNESVTVCVQAPTPDTLKILPQGVKLEDTIDVWMAGGLGKLNTQRANGYSDVLIWDGERYVALVVVEDFSNFGEGFTHAVFSREKPHG